MTMRAITSCYGCGVGLDLERVQPSPFRVCPVCKAPLDNGAIEHQHHLADNPANPKDPRRAASIEQSMSDVAGLHADYASAKAARGAPGADLSALREKVAELESRVAAMLADATGSTA